MKLWKANRIIRLPSGAIVRLTEKQAKPRLRRMKSLGDGLYELKDWLDFKRGETFGYDGHLDASDAHLVDDSIEGAHRQESRKER